MYSSKRYMVFPSTLYQFYVHPKRCQLRVLESRWLYLVLEPSCPELIVPELSGLLAPELI